MSLLGGAAGDTSFDTGLGNSTGTSPPGGGAGGPPAFAFPTPNYINPEQRATQLRTSIIALCCVAWVLVLLRFWSRMYMSGKIRADDIVIWIGLAFTTALTVCLSEATRYGIGYHFYDIPAHWWLPQTRLVFIVGMLYNPCLGLIKSSLILFYLRLAPHRAYRLTAYFVLFLAIATAVGCTVFAIFACNPVDFHWNPHHYGSFHPGLPGVGVKCYDLMTMLVVFGALNTVTDVATLVLPVPLVWRVRLPARKKFELAVVFGLGAFACITSVIRTIILNQARSSGSMDYSYNLFLSHLWSITEPVVGIVCASLPVIRPLFLRMFPGKDPKKSTSPGSMPEFVSGTKEKEHSERTGRNGWGKYGISETVLMESRIEEEREVELGSLDGGRIRRKDLA